MNKDQRIVCIAFYMLGMLTALLINISFSKEEKVEITTTTTTTEQTTTSTTTTTTKKVNKVVRQKENKEEYKRYAHELVISNGWSEEDYEYLVKIFNRESGWSIYAKNGSCYGIPQSCPGSKMSSSGSDYKTNYKTQINWGINYIKNRYGSPTKAWEHIKRKGWY